MGFAGALARMDRSVSKRLSDCTAEHFTASGALRASGLEVMVSAGVERMDEVTGAVDRVVTIACRKSFDFDRGGSFTSANSPILGAKTWHIDGIASDDGGFITFFVVP